MRPGTAAALALASIVVVASGCAPGEEGTSGNGQVARDSAGIRIVEHPAGPRDTVRLEAPLLTIGRDDDPRYQFHRIQDVAALSGGRVVVADRGSHEVRYYSPEGRHLASLGGEGEGPGEFRFLDELQVLAGDTVVADGVSNRRLTLVSPEPALARSVDYRERLADRPEGVSACAVGGSRFGGMMASGALVLFGWSCVRGEGTGGLRAFRRTVHIWPPGAPSGAEEAVDLEPHPVAWRLEQPGEDIRNRFPPVPLSAGVDLHVAGNRIYRTSPERYAVEALDERGRPTLIIRRRRARRPVDAAIRAAFEESMPPERLEGWATSHYPDSLPAYDRVLAGGGEVWARHFRGPTDSLTHWSVRARDGEFRGTVASPGSFELTAVRNGRLYGIVTDELGVERVRVFAHPLLE